MLSRSRVIETDWTTGYTRTIRRSKQIPRRRMMRPRRDSLYWTNKYTSCIIFRRSSLAIYDTPRDPAWGGEGNVDLHLESTLMSMAYIFPLKAPFRVPWNLTKNHFPSLQTSFHQLPEFARQRCLYPKNIVKTTCYPWPGSWQRSSNMVARKLAIRYEISMMLGCPQCPRLLFKAKLTSLIIFWKKFHCSICHLVEYFLPREEQS